MALSACGSNLRPELTVKEHPRPRSLGATVQWVEAASSLAGQMKLEVEHLQSVDWPCKIERATQRKGKTARYTTLIGYTSAGWPRRVSTLTKSKRGRLYTSTATTNSYQGSRLTRSAVRINKPGTSRLMLELREGFLYKNNQLQQRITTLHSARTPTPKTATRYIYLFKPQNDRVIEGTQMFLRRRGKWSPVGKLKPSRQCTVAKNLAGYETCIGKSPYAVTRSVTGRILTRVNRGKKTTRIAQYLYDDAGRVSSVTRTTDGRETANYTFFYDPDHAQRISRIEGTTSGKPATLAMTYICED